MVQIYVCISIYLYVMVYLSYVRGFSCISILHVSTMTEFISSILHFI